MSVYPASAAHAYFRAGLERLWEAASHRFGCTRRVGSDGDLAGRGLCVHYDFEGRLQLHDLVELLLRTASHGELPNIGLDSVSDTSTSIAKAASSWRLPYQPRCEAMMGQVTSLATSSEEDRLNSAWARRTYIFQRVYELHE